MVNERSEFVWRIGVLRFGLGLAALSIAEDLFSTVKSTERSWGDFTLDLLLNLLFFGLLGGYLFGRLMWYFGARRR